MTVQSGPTLTDAKGMGGIIAQDGFDYQVWDAIARLPAWLRNSNFEGLIIEGLEDFEARFFAPHAPSKHLLDRFQAKSGTLTKSDIVDVLKSFKAFNAAHPDVSRVQTLVTPALPATLNWIARDPGRVRKARPFYSPFPAVCAASDDKLRKDLVAEFGDDLGIFFADYVEIDLRTFPDRSHAEAAFFAAMQIVFSEIDVSMGKLKTAFSELTGLIGKNRGVMLSRCILLKVLKEALGTPVMPEKSLCVHIRSDRNAPMMDAIEINASEFSGVDGQFPEPAIWLSGLIEPMTSAAKWASEHDQKRIALTGTYRLSTAFAVGWTFRSAIGFDIDIHTRSGSWSTDNHPSPGAQQLDWEVVQPKCLRADRLLVVIGVVRDPRLDIISSLGLSGEDELLIAMLPGAIVNGTDAQSSVQLLKAVVSQAVSQFNPKGIDLYFVGPAALAVALGHRWNALPATQFFEFDVSNRRYIPSVAFG